MSWPWGKKRASEPPEEPQPQPEPEPTVEVTDYEIYFKDGSVFKLSTTEADESKTSIDFSDENENRYIIIMNDSVKYILEKDTRTLGKKDLLKKEIGLIQSNEGRREVATKKRT
jgi:hypothetical protein